MYGLRKAQRHTEREGGSKKIWLGEEIARAQQPPSSESDGGGGDDVCDRRHLRRKARWPHCALEFPLSSTNIPQIEEIQLKAKTGSPRPDVRTQYV